MIDICNNGTRLAGERWQQFLASPVGVYLYSVATAATGVIILLFFFSMVLSTGALLLLLPLIIAFNAAAAGYGLMDRCSAFPHPKMGLLSMSVLLAATGYLAIPVLFPWEPLLEASRAALSSGAALAGILFGAWIARKKGDTATAESIEM
ncbi:hypothetical protein [Desulfogranum mediterraneum]|uniref:hypothetical protein n=1 Tax=Desulfogranum mediterraneum TaxID=160661 RepID=UPI000427B0CF|nr:hypothetical protein [Desulfogranum mediterraneum]